MASGSVHAASRRPGRTRTRRRPPGRATSPARCPQRAEESAGAGAAGSAGRAWRPSLDRVPDTRRSDYTVRHREYILCRRKVREADWIEPLDEGSRTTAQSDELNRPSGGAGEATASSSVHRRRATGEPFEIGLDPAREPVAGGPAGELGDRRRRAAREHHDVAEPPAAQHRRVGDQAALRQHRADRGHLTRGRTPGAGRRQRSPTTSRPARAPAPPRATNSTDVRWPASGRRRRRRPRSRSYPSARMPASASRASPTRTRSLVLRIPGQRPADSSTSAPSTSTTRCGEPGRVAAT